MHRSPDSNSLTRSVLVPFRAGAVTLLLALAAALPSAAGSSLGAVRLELVADGFTAPVAITHAGDDRLFVTQLDGRVRIVEADGSVVPIPFLDISDRVLSGGERGLFSIAFDPGYATNRYFYAYYTDLGGTVVIRRFRRRVGDPDSAAIGSERVLLRIEQPFSNHNGGQLQFGPDGYLYAGTGDGGSGFDPLCRAQDLTSMLGKMLRLDVAGNRSSPPYYAIPPDNPFVGSLAIPNEIWALGLRNPWRFSFDRATGDLWIGDVGQSTREEIDFVAAGTPGAINFGWKMLEGSLCLGSSSGCGGPLPGCGSPAYTPPLFEYAHEAGNCSITGGTVYRSSQVPALAGLYVYGDFCSGAVWALDRAVAPPAVVRLPPSAPGLTSFGEDASGEIYLAHGSRVSRLVGDLSTAPDTIAFSAAATAVGEADGAASLSVTRSGNGVGAVGVAYELEGESATAGADFAGTGGSIEWSAGDLLPKSLAIPILDDGEDESDETLRVRLVSAAGNAVVGTPDEAVVTILDDDQPPEPCVADATTLCLEQGRFRARIRFRTALGQAGDGVAQTLTDDSGYFWFFTEDNPEVFVKVRNACAAAIARFWVFSAGLTNVETELTVVDTETGASRLYVNPLGRTYEAVLDTAAFATCP